jgi:hypothetical protein
MSKNVSMAEEIVNEIINDICDRSGIGDEWDNLDKDVEEEIIDGWKEIILEILSR